MSIIAAVVVAIIVWIICAYVVPEEYAVINENGLAIGAIVGLGAWVYPKLMSDKHGHGHI